MDDRPDDNNPFKGTPFEQIFNALGGTGGSGGLGALGGLGGQGGGMPDLSGLMGQMQAMMQPYDGPVNWALATDIARRTSAQEPDPSPDRNDQTRVADAMRLADHWLDDATVLPSGVTTTAAWSRAEWIEQTTEVWRVLVEPVAEHVVAAMGNAMPEEARAMAGPLIGMIGKAGGAMFGSQVGAALGGLAGEVLTASDIGLPLGPAGKAALRPPQHRGVRRRASTSRDDDVLLYLSLREAAHQRLFAHVPWLRQHLISSVEDFGRGVTIDISGIEQAMGQLDPTNLEAIQEALQGGLFEPQQTPEQKAALGSARDHARAGRGLGRRGRRPGHRRADARRRARCRRRSGAAAPPAVPPRRPSPRSSGSSCARAGCATPPPCGARCAPARARRPATPSGPTRTCCRRAADLDDPLGFREDLPEVDRAQRRGLRQGDRRAARHRVGRGPAASDADPGDE